MYRLEHGGKSTKEGTRSGVDRRERMKRGSGIKDRDERSKGIEILMADAFGSVSIPSRCLFR